METTAEATPTPSATESMFVLVRVANHLCGVPVDHVREIILAPAASPVPRAPACVRGVFNIRGQVLTAMDLRMRLGHTSTAAEREELSTNLEQREQEHVSWLKELEASLVEDREFTLATDPHQCKFGRWYDNYKPNNPMLTYHLGLFDEPHKRIHGLAQKCHKLRAEGKTSQAIDLVQRARGTTLKQMVTLFHDFQRLLNDSSWEIAVVVKVDNHSFAVVVDGVESLEHLVPSDSTVTGQQGPEGGPVKALSFRKGKETVVPTIDLPFLSRELRGTNTSDAMH